MLQNDAVVWLLLFEDAETLGQRHYYAFFYLFNKYQKEQEQIFTRNQYFSSAHVLFTIKTANFSFYFFFIIFLRMAQKFHKNQQTQIYIDILFMICIPPFIFSSLLAILSNIPTVQYLFVLSKNEQNPVFMKHNNVIYTHTSTSLICRSTIFT